MFVQALDIPTSKLSEAAHRVLDRAAEDLRRREHPLLTSTHLLFAIALQNVIQRAVIRSADDCLDVPLEEIREAAVPVPDGTGTLEAAERAHILATLNDTRWVLSGPRGAATRLGINRSTLQFRMKKLGIARPTDCGNRMS